MRPLVLRASFFAMQQTSCFFFVSIIRHENPVRQEESLQIQVSCLQKVSCSYSKKQVI